MTTSWEMETSHAVTRDAEVHSANATLSEQRSALFQRLVDGASGAEVVGAFIPTDC